MRAALRPTTLVVALVSLLALTTTAALAHGNNVVSTQTPSEAEVENDPDLELLHHIEFENTEDGAVTLVEPDGERESLGRVIRPAKQPLESSAGFWAAHYIGSAQENFGAVMATSVHNIHMKVGPERPYNPLNPEQWRPWQLSLTNAEKYDEAYHAEWLDFSDNTIYTDIDGGKGIFGGAETPTTGGEVEYHDGNRWRPITQYFTGDWETDPPELMRLAVYRPTTEHGALKAVEFENWGAGDELHGETLDDNGRILAHYEDGTVRHVADVLERVQGSGRFGGSEYAQPGGVSTQHGGAIELSTSPFVGQTWDIEERGGLQILPPNHAKYLSYDLGQDSFIGLDQWMIVGPVGATPDRLYDDRYTIEGRLSFDPGWEGVAPLFATYLRPLHVDGDPEASAHWEVSEDFGQSWEDPPELQGTTFADEGSPVADWTNIKVYPGW